MDSAKKVLNRGSVADPAEDRITLAELDRTIRTADPKARLILPRILRRIIKLDRRLTGFAFRIPHRKSYTIDRQSLLEIAEPEEVGFQPNEILPDKIILLAQPDPQKLSEMRSGDAVIQYWRLLFHARVHLAIDERIAENTLNPGVLRERIDQIGRLEFDEIGTILGQEGFLLPPQSELSMYEEFAAVFLELRYFAWNALPRYFPSLENLDAIENILRRDVDAHWLFMTTRPLNAPDPIDRTTLEDLESWTPAADEAIMDAPRSQALPSRDAIPQTNA